MNQWVFKDLMGSVGNARSVDHQIYLITVTIGRVGGIFTSQVAQLVKLIPCPKGRLEIAKMAYGYTHDREYYAEIVGDALGFDNARPLLNDYLRFHR